MTSNQNSNSSTIVANCPSCNGLVRIPIDAPSNSVVRCPHCSQSYSISEIAAELIPEVEMVDESVSQPEEVVPHVDRVLENKTELGERQKFVVPPQLSKGAKRRSRRRKNTDDSGSEEFAQNDFSQVEAEVQPAGFQPGIEIEEHDTPAVGDFDSGVRSTDSGVRSSGSRPRSSESGGRSSRSRERRSRGSRTRRHSSSSRRSGKQSGPNPTFEMLKVIIGGLLAIPVAYGIVMGVFAQDPLNLAPTISKVAPFLVPESLRPEEESDQEPGNGSASEPTKQDDPIVDLENGDLPIPEIDPDNIYLQKQ